MTATAFPGRYDSGAYGWMFTVTAMQRTRLEHKFADRSGNLAHSINSFSQSVID